MSSARRDTFLKTLRDMARAAGKPDHDGAEPAKKDRKAAKPDKKKKKKKAKKKPADDVAAA